MRRRACSWQRAAVVGCRKVGGASAECATCPISLVRTSPTCPSKRRVLMHTPLLEQGVVESRRGDCRTPPVGDGKQREMHRCGALSFVAPCVAMTVVGGDAAPAESSMRSAALSFCAPGRLCVRHFKLFEHSVAQRAREAPQAEGLARKSAALPLRYRFAFHV